MSGNPLSSDDKDVIRGFMIASKFVYCQRVENGGRLPYRMVVKIGERFWETSYESDESDDATDQVRLFSARHQAGDVIIALRLEIQSMMADLGEDYKEVVSDKDLAAGVNNTLAAVAAMKTIDGCLCTCKNLVDSASKVAVVSFGTVSYGYTGPTELIAYACLFPGIGYHAILCLVKQYDDLVKRWASCENVTDRLMGRGKKSKITD